MNKWHGHLGIEIAVGYIIAYMQRGVHVFHLIDLGRMCGAFPKYFVDIISNAGKSGGARDENVLMCCANSTCPFFCSEHALVCVRACVCVYAVRYM